MLLLHVYQLLLYNFLQANTRNVAVFHCWSTQVALPLAQLFSEELYAHYVHLDRIGALENFQNRYLASKLPKQGVFLAMNCARSEELIKELSREGLFTHWYHWILYDQYGSVDKMEKLFEIANLSINTDLTYVMPKPNAEDNDSNNNNNNNNTSIFVLYDIYNKGSHIGGKLNITVDQEVACNVSACAVRQYLSDLHKTARLQQRRDLSSVTFRIATIVTQRPLTLPEHELIAYLSSEVDPHKDSLVRLGFNMLKVVQDVLQFNTSHIWSHLWSENDYIGGAIGAVVNETAELATSPFVFSPGRSRYLNGLTEISSFRSVCIFRTPQSADVKAGVFLEPFTAEVWLVFAGLLLFIGLLLWYMFRLEQQCMWQYLGFVPSLLTTCLISFGSACIQGSYLTPRSIGGRVAFFALMLTSILMYNYYTSIVVSSLLGSPVRSSIRTVQQLADSSLDVGFEPIPFTTVYLDSSPRPDIRSLVKQKVEANKDANFLWLSPSDGVMRVRDQPGFVFISEASSIFYFIEKYYLPHEICELNEILFRPEGALYSFMHRNSSYRELYKQVEVRLAETGIQRKHRHYWIRTQLHCFASNYVIKVGMEYAAPLFIMLLCAYVLVLIVLAIEILTKRYSTRRQRALTPTAN